MLKFLSILGFLMMVAAVAGLFMIDALFSPELLAIKFQMLAIALVVWARITFGKRSFHYAANPTAGGLVTSGPYRYIRHPIYTGLVLFCVISIIANWSAQDAARLGTLGGLLLAGGVIRMLCEEQLLARMYPEYADYRKTTYRMVPYLF